MGYIVDKYFWVARVAPGVVVALPVVAAIFTAAPGLHAVLESLYAKAGVSAAALLLLGSTVRYLGRKIEPGLWESWGGAPTVRLLRWSDGAKTREWKQGVRAKVSALTGITLPDPGEEAERPSEADALIADACGMLRPRLRGTSHARLVGIANMEYGFTRNLLGSRLLWMLASVLGIVISVLGQVAGCPAAFWGLVLSAAWLLASTIVGFCVLPGLTRHIAQRYAEEFWAVVTDLPDRSNGKEAPDG